MLLGRAFHRSGAATANDLSAKVFECVRGITSKSCCCPDPDLRPSRLA